ncbi:BBOX1 [Branchiostoma lanceolatum]|uniref:BBOX1 protein n=1 Tax=Branchiostoma lanceolatum TaxID=7740 RepID=A0A8J9ZS00_BRALA|nr:BBOX1 [Branchiostoma lanceolatum]
MSHGLTKASPGEGIKKATAVDTEEVLKVEWSTGGVSKYPYVWLRDNCQCPKCFAAEHNNRRIMTSDIDLDAAPVTTVVSGKDRGSSLYVTWPDGHRSQYDWQWLRDRCFSPRARADREKQWKNKIVVKSKPDDVRTSEADSTRHLEIHNDEPYYSYAPGVQLLHYIEQTKGEGGTSLLVDSFNAAYQLKEEDPEAFWLLTTFKVHFIHKKAKHKAHIRNICKIISLDDQGEVQRVNYMMIARDSIMDVPLDQVKPFHRALKAFNALLYHTENCLHLKMKAGEMYAVDNGRTLHGRTAFNPADGVRHLRGGYLDWDGRGLLPHARAQGRPRHPVVAMQ